MAFAGLFSAGVPDCSFSIVQDLCLVFAHPASSQGPEVVLQEPYHHFQFETVPEFHESLICRELRRYVLLDVVNGELHKIRN